MKLFSEFSKKEVAITFNNSLRLRLRLPLQSSNPSLSTWYAMHRALISIFAFAFVFLVQLCFLICKVNFTIQISRIYMCLLCEKKEGFLNYD